jgi:hypothetical protein
MFGKIEGDIENAVTGDRDELKDALFEDLRGLKGFVTMLGEISEYSAQESIRQESQQGKKKPNT